MKIFSSKKRAAAIGAVTAATLITGTVAFAYWTASGTGTGSATAGSTSEWEVRVAPIEAGVLAPTDPSGNPVQTVSYVIANTGTGIQHLDKVVVTVGTIENGGAGDGACSPSDFQLGNPADGQTYTESSINKDLPVELDAQAASDPGRHAGSVQLRLVDTGFNQDKCKGATVNLNVAAS